MGGRFCIDLISRSSVQCRIYLRCQIFEYYNEADGRLLQTPRNPVAQLCKRLTKGRFFGSLLDYKLHFFPAFRAVVNAGLINQTVKDHDMHLHFTATSGYVIFLFCTNEFSKVKEKQATGMLSL
jgi:hypothetical protein